MNRVKCLHKLLTGKNKGKNCNNDTGSIPYCYIHEKSHKKDIEIFLEERQRLKEDYEEKERCKLQIQYQLSE